MFASNIFKSHTIVKRKKEMSQKSLKIVTWNILADIWVNEKFYKGIPPALLNKNLRYTRTKAVLNLIDADVVMLQEVELDIYLKLRRYYKLKYVVVKLYANEEKLWRSELAPHKKMQLSGNLILIRRNLAKDIQAASLKLSKDGDVAGLIRFTWRRTKYMMVNVHLSTTKKTRGHEIRTLLQSLELYSNYRLIIAGDFNARPTDQIHKLLTSKGFRTKTELQVHTYYNTEHVDYVYVRAVPIQSGHVYNDLLLLHKGVYAKQDLLEKYGSDHLPVTITI